MNFFASQLNLYNTELNADNISTSHSDSVIENNQLIFRRIKQTLFFMIKNYITKKLNICKDIDQLNNEILRLYNNLGEIIMICEQLSVNQFKFNYVSVGDQEFYIDIVNTLECEYILLHYLILNY